MATLIIFFLISRFYLAFFYNTPVSDTIVYGQYAWDFSESLEQGASFYDTRHKTVEYPPLAVLWMSVPTFFMHNDSTRDTYTLAKYNTWKFFFKLGYFLFDLAIFGFLLFLYVSPQKECKVDGWGLLMYTVAGLVLFNFLYDRQDFWLGGIILVSVVLLLSRLNWVFSFLVLAVGINFKLIPLLLAPLFIIGSLPARPYKKVVNPYLVKAVLKRTATLSVMVLLLFLPFYIRGGGRTLDFLAYHGERGLQLESTFSSFLMLLNYLGLHVHVTHGFGGFNLVSPLAPFLAKISPLLVLCTVVWVCLIFIKVVKFQTVRDKIPNMPTKQVNFAQSAPEIFIILVIVTLLAAIATSKVFSPQYLLWVIPLFALVSFGNKQLKMAGIFYIATCLCTFMIFPYLYFTEFIHNGTRLPDGTILWSAPSMLATDILLIRNVLLIATTLTLVYAATKLMEKKFDYH